jgi:hypothetical protein
MYPTITCAIAFATQPLQTPVWVDVSDRLRDTISIRRGRQHELGRVEAGTCSLTLDNRDRAFDPTNMSSPFAPHVLPRKRIRLQATLPGVTNGTQAIDTSGTDGLFRLSVGGQMTGALDQTTTASQVQTALEALSTVGSGNVTITGPTGGNWIATFGGRWWGGTAPTISIVAPTLESSGTPSVTTTTAGGSGCNRIYELSLDTATGGYAGFMFRASGYSTVTVLLYPNSTASTVALIGNYWGAAQLAVTGPTGGPWFVEFVGALARSNSPTIVTTDDLLLPASAQPTAVVVQAAVSGNETQRINLSAPSAGLWRAAFSGQQTGDLAWNIAASALQTALEALSTIGTGNVSVSSPGAGLYDVTFQGVLGAADQPLLTLAGGVIDDAPSVSVADAAAATTDLFTGFIAGWPLADAGADATVPIQAIDALALFARTTLADGDTITGQRSDLMVGAVLDAVGWPASDRSLQVGASTLATYTASGAPTVLSVLQLIADSENGVVFVDASGAVIFQNRHARIVQGASLATFGDGGPLSGELPYSAITLAYDDSEIFNTVTVTALAGLPQIATAASSQAAYFPSAYTRSQTLIATDGEAFSAATFLVNRYQEPGVRVPQLALRGLLDPTALWPQILARQIGDRVTAVKRLVRSGVPITRDVTIEAVAHTIQRDRSGGGRDWVTTWELSPVAQANFWILGDPVWSVLGTTTIPSY